jgi:undecaprenyl-diphosphatase
MEHIQWWQAAILGLIQGLTEFIPVSSSAHLNITHWLLGQEERFLAFDVMLHIGTLMALAFYFRRDWVNLICNREWRGLRNLVFLACVPAVIAGLLLRDAEDNMVIFKDVRFNALMLIIAGGILWWSDIVGRKVRKIDNITTVDALLIGASQAFALIPGVSRSGATITMGLFRGFDRETAARFSFLMSLPITLGAVAFEAKGALSKGALQATGATLPVIAVGIITSGLSGFWAISFLLDYLKKHDVRLFVFWRWAVGALVLAWSYWRGV